MRLNRYASGDAEGEDGMLILGRKIGQTINIGNDIEVTLLGYNKDNSIRVGIVAPRSVDVHRKEVYERIQREGSLRDKLE